MRISTKGRYGLRAIIDIAKNNSGNALPLREIAKIEGVSEKYLEHILKKLNSAGLVRSIRGSRGGYVLNMPCKEITAGMVLRALEGSISPTSCVAEGECEKGVECAAAYVWHKLKDAIDGVVDNITLDEICENTEKEQEK